MSDIEAVISEEIMGVSVGRSASRSVLATGRAQVILGLLILAIGTLVYVVDRSAESTPFFSAINVAHLLPSLFGPLGESLPTFAHAFAFSLLTATCLGAGRRNAFIACFGWFGIDSVFEAGQHSWFSETLASLIPSWFAHVPILRNTGAYFVSGTFDFRDLFSIALGALAAYLVVVLTVKADEPRG